MMNFGKEISGKRGTRHNTRYNGALLKNANNGKRKQRTRKGTTRHASPSKKGQESKCNINPQRESVLNSIYVVIIIYYSNHNIIINKYINDDRNEILLYCLIINCGFIVG